MDSGGQFVGVPVSVAFLRHVSGESAHMPSAYRAVRPSGRSFESDPHDAARFGTSRDL